MRPWRDIAREMINLTDDVRMAELQDELKRAIAEQGIDDDQPIIWLPTRPN